MYNDIVIVFFFFRSKHVFKIVFSFAEGLILVVVMSAYISPFSGSVSCWLMLMYEGLFWRYYFKFEFSVLAVLFQKWSRTNVVRWIIHSSKLNPKHKQALTLVHSLYLSPEFKMAKWQEMPDWSELQHDLLVLIVRHLNLIEDYLNFGTVCKSWRSVATKNNFNSDLPRVPWLMLAEEEDDSIDSMGCRKFVSLYNGMILKKKVPKASGKRCMESMGWLITVEEDEGGISLLHPFSGVRIELPHQTLLNSWAVVRKAVLSANPSHTSDYILMIIGGKSRLLGFWRSGDLSWTSVADRYTTLCFRDAVYYNGHFYAVDNRGTVLVCDVDSPDTTEKHILACVEGSKDHTREMQWPPPHDRQFYILESLGSLFVVMQYGVASRKAKGDGDRIPLTSIFEDSDGDGDDDEYTYGTTNFLVFQADLAAGRLRQTRDLGDRAFFLGANSSLSVQASQFPGIKPNHIYFTDNCWHTYFKYKEGGGLDMGVFNLADGSIQPHYEGVSLSRVCPPTWITPTLC